MITKIKVLISFLFICSCSVLRAQVSYFPPVPANGNWESISPADLGWCEDKIDSLYTYLETNNTKGFLVLKDGKIVLEKYFGTFTQDSLWYWASAGKTLTAFLVGKAQEDGYLNISDKTSAHLGNGWTNCSPTQEDQITVLNQLTMTSGLDDGVPNVDCTLDTCLVYKADAGTRWAYHNAPYTLLENVVENASGINYNLYTTQSLKNKIGMNGLWIRLDYNNVFFSNLRSMARYGLLMQNKCIWNNDTLLRDTAYVNAMTRSSQQLNKSYGYLWWLNGKESFMLPSLQLVFQGSYAPDAPSDMFAALGKNGQIVGISPSQSLVVVRMGNPPGQGILVPTVFYNEIWKNLNKVICGTNPVSELNNNAIKIYPNPLQVSDKMKLEFSLPLRGHIELLNSLGQVVKAVELEEVVRSTEIELNGLSAGVYILKFFNESSSLSKKFSILN